MLGQTELKANWFSHTLFESPWMAIVLLALVWMSMRIVGRRTDNKKLTRGSWVPLALVAVLFIVSEAVTTKKEKLIAALDDMLLSVEDKDWPAFRQVVDEGVVIEFDRGSVVKEFNLQATYSRDEVERRIESAQIKDLLLLGAEPAILSDGRTAVTVIRVRADGMYAGVAGLQFTEWAVEWHYDGQRWRATRLTCLKVGTDALFNKS